MDTFYLAMNDGKNQLVDVHFPTTDGRTLILPRFTEPAPQQRMILEKLGLALPPQPLPRIRAAAVATAAEVGKEIASD
jgi:hypothetical protein